MFFFSSMEIFFFVYIRYFFFRFDKNFGRKGKFFFRLSSILEILEKREISFLSIFERNFKEKKKGREIFFFSYGMKILKTYPLSAI